MKLLLIIPLAMLTACSPVLGVRVHRYVRHDVPYISCRVVVDERQPQLGVESRRICQDAIQAPAIQPLKK